MTQAIAIAGGFKDTAKHSQILLFHRVSEGWVSAKKIDLKDMLAQGNLREDPYLRPGDTAFVPKNQFPGLNPSCPSPGSGRSQPHQIVPMKVQRVSPAQAAPEGQRKSTAFLKLLSRGKSAGWFLNSTN